MYLIPVALALTFTIRHKLHLPQMQPINCVELWVGQVWLEVPVAVLMLGESGCRPAVCAERRPWPAKPEVAQAWQRCASCSCTGQQSRRAAADFHNGVVACGRDLHREIRDNIEATVIYQFCAAMF